MLKRKWRALLDGKVMSYGNENGRDEGESLIEIGKGGWRLFVPTA